MKKVLALCFVAGSLYACGNDSATEQVRDNETPVAGQDQVDNRMTTPDTLIIDSTQIR